VAKNISKSDANIYSKIENNQASIIMTNFHLYNLLQHTTVVVIFLKTKKHGQETPFPNFLCGCSQFQILTANVF